MYYIMSYKYQYVPSYQYRLGACKCCFKLFNANIYENTVKVYNKKLAWKYEILDSGLL